jgi:hypothetical protein
MITAVLRSAQAGAILTAVGLSAGLMTGVAEAEPSRGEHFCISPIFVPPPSGTTSTQDLKTVEAFLDLNQRYNVKERIIGPPGFNPATPQAPGAYDETDDPAAAGDKTKRDGCLEAYPDEQWIRAVPPWITASSDNNGDKIPDKIKEFTDRFVSARYVIDGKDNVVTDPKKLLFQGTVPDIAGLLPDWTRGKPFIVPVSPVFPALSAGDHTTILYVTISAGDPVCNGLPGQPPDSPPIAPGLNTNCLPAGESQWPIAAPQPATIKVPPVAP